MKKRYSFLLLASLLWGAAPARAQLSGSDSLELKLARVFAHVDKSQVPTGYLHEAGVRLLDLRYYSGVLSDSNRTDLDVLRYLRLITQSARVYGPDPLPTLSAYNARLDSATAAAGGAIPLSVQYLAYASIKPTALQDNLLTVQQEQVYDTPGRTQSPYQTQVLFAAAPTISRARTNTVSFLFRRSLYLAGTGAAPSALYLDFGDGAGYRSAAWDQPLATIYATAGVKRVKVMFVYYHEGSLNNVAPAAKGTDGASKIAPGPGPGYKEAVESWFDFDVWRVAPVARTTGTANCAICDSEMPFNSSNATGAEHSGGTAFVIYGKGSGGARHTQLTKPFIISEGYNLYDIAEELRKCNNPNNTVEEFFDKIDKSFYTNGSINFRAALQNAGYDIVYIDNARGTDDIVRNAHLFEAVVRWVNQSKVGQSSPGAERNVVMGQSMGGLVSRYGLAEMAKRPNNSDNPHTRLLVLHDSPQRGANNPAGLQSLGRSFDVPFLFGKSLADLNKQVRATVDVLNQPATQQLSILNAFNGRSDIRANTFIPTIYEPMIAFSGPAPYDIVAVSNGSQCGNGQNTPVGVAIAQSSLAFLLPIPYIGPVGVTGNFAAYGLPAYGQQAIVSQVDLRLEYQIRIGKCPFCVTIPIRFRLLKESAVSPPNTLPLETLPGGSTNPRQEAGSCADDIDFGSLNGVYAAYFRTNLYNGDLCFVPSYSALDVETVTPGTAFSRYINNTTSNPSPPRVLHYIAQENVNNAGTKFNVSHISFTPRNSEWIFNEMQGTSNSQLCSSECIPIPAVTIVGPEGFCASGVATYRLSNTQLPAGASVEWTATPGGIVTPVSGTGPSFTVTAIGGTLSNNFTLTARIRSAGGCVLREATRTVSDQPTFIQVWATPLNYSPTGAVCRFDPVQFHVGTTNYDPATIQWFYGSPGRETRGRYDLTISNDIHEVHIQAGNGVYPNDRLSVYVKAYNYCSNSIERSAAVVVMVETNCNSLRPGGAGNETTPKPAAALYPNPARETVDVRIDHASVAHPVTVRLYDSYGQPRAEQTSTGEQTVRLKTDQLPAGLYFVHLLRGSEVLSREQLRIEK